MVFSGGRGFENLRGGSNYRRRKRAAKQKRRRKGKGKNGRKTTAYPLRAPMRGMAADTRVNQSDLELLCSLTDPFCASAYGGRICDSNNSGSIAHTEHQTLSVKGTDSTTGADDGLLAVKVFPTFEGCFKWADRNSGSWTDNIPDGYDSSDVQDYDVFKTVAIESRTASAGIIITVSAAASASGWITVTAYPTRSLYDAAESAEIFNYSPNQTVYSVQSLLSRGDSLYLPFLVDDQDKRLVYASTSASEDSQHHDAGYNSYFIAGVGLGASVVVKIDLIEHLECKLTLANSGFFTPSAEPNNQRVLDASQELQSRASDLVGYKAEDRSGIAALVTDIGKQLLSGLARSGFEALSSMVLV
jgi:hypothetical protein